MQTLAQKTDGKRRQVRKANLSPRRTKRHLPQMPTAARVMGAAPNRPTATLQTAGTLISRRSGRRSYVMLAAQGHCVQAQNGKRRESFESRFKSAPHTEGIARATCVSAHKKYCCNKPKTSRSAHGSHAQLHPRTCATHAERRSTTTKRNGQIARSL